MVLLDFNNIGELEKEYALEALSEGQISTRGSYVEKFEEAVSRFLNAPYVFATNSGTAALHLALLACDIGPGDSVVIPALSFIATKNVILHVGATPIIVDVDPVTWVMQPIATKYPVMPVDLYGNPSPVKYPLIRDACESFGTEATGFFTVYSFNGNKTITTGGGGLLVCPSKDALEVVKAFGIPGECPSYNYRMTSISAAIGLAQLKRIPELLARKRRINEIYREELGGLLDFQEPTKGVNPTWWMTAVYCPDLAIDFAEKLKERGIPTRRVFRPLADNDCPEAWHIYHRGLCLPSSTLNTDEDILHVCRTVKSIL